MTSHRMQHRRVKSHYVRYYTVFSAQITARYSEKVNNAAYMYPLDMIYVPVYMRYMGVVGVY